MGSLARKSGSNRTAPRVVLAALAAVCFFLTGNAGLAHTANISLQITPCFNGLPLAFDSLTNRTAAGQMVSVTRLDFLLSHFALRQADGVWVEQTNWFAFFSPRDGRNRAKLRDVSQDVYDRVRFCVGLTPDINHQSVAVYPAEHPLNPGVNNLYWGWMGGYVFLALEGNWRHADGAASGFSYHIATDQQLMTVEMPLPMDLSTNVEMRLILNVDKIFSAPNQIVLNEADASTHSRTNDLLAVKLRENIEHAFLVEGVSEIAPPQVAATPASPVEMAATAHPYRLTISSYFPRPDLPRDNPLTDEGVALGKRLFAEPRLSINNSQACASCHKAARVFTDGRKVSVGAEGQAGERNAMALVNLAWKSSFFWDGRAASIREQVLQPIQNPIEMHETLGHVTAKLAADSQYPPLFAAAFGTPEITADRLARALEQFLLVQVSHDSKFDRMLAGEVKFTDEEKRGMDLFHTEYDPRRGQLGADCFHCHGGPLFQSQGFGNNGLDAEFADAGRYKVTGREGDRGKFAVPSLRNVEMTAPYMHDGRFQTLEQVVEHYCTGMKRSPTLDPNLGKHPDHGLPLSDPDKHALVAFLKTLTDERFRGETNTLAANGLAQ